MRIEEIIANAIESINEYDMTQLDAEDIAHEIADGAVPVYTYDLLEAAMHDNELATDEPEIIAYDGRPTPVNVIAGNIYERVYGAVYDEIEDRR